MDVYNFTFIDGNTNQQGSKTINGGSYETATESFYDQMRLQGMEPRYVSVDCKSTDSFSDCCHYFGGKRATKCCGEKVNRVTRKTVSGVSRMTRQEIEKKIAELQKRLAEMPEKWEPKGGRFIIQYDGTVYGDIDSHHKRSKFGIEYTTREQAEKAAKAMRAHNRLLAYVAEFVPDYNFVEGECNRYVYFDCTSGLFRTHCDIYARNLGTVYMPEHVAIELAAKLNSGEVEL